MLSTKPVSFLHDQIKYMSQYPSLATSETQNLISIKDFSAIINDPIHFTTAFFLTASEKISSKDYIGIELHDD